MCKAVQTDVIIIVNAPYTLTGVDVLAVSCGFDTNHLHSAVDPEDGDCSIFITDTLGGDVQGQVCLDNESARVFLERLLQEVNRYAR